MFENLNITDDELVEGEETFEFVLQNVSGGINAQIGSNSTLTLTITDNDTAPLDTEVEFAVNELSATEGDGAINISAIITNPSDTEDTTVEMALTSGSSDDLDGFTSFTFTFPAGSDASQNLN